MGCLPLKVHSAPSVEVGGHIYPVRESTTQSVSSLIWSLSRGKGGGEGGGFAHLDQLVVAAHLTVTADPVAMRLDEVRLVFLLAHVAGHRCGCPCFHLGGRSFEHFREYIETLGAGVCG